MVLPGARLGARLPCTRPQTVATPTRASAAATTTTAAAVAAAVAAAAAAAYPTTTKVAAAAAAAAGCPATGSALRLAPVPVTRAGPARTLLQPAQPGGAAGVPCAQAQARPVVCLGRCEAAGRGPAAGTPRAGGG